VSEPADEAGLKVVDAFDLDAQLRGLLRPGSVVRDHRGREHKLPRYFYEISSRDDAVRARLAPNFGLNEFIRVDLKEAPRLQEYPKYIPCAVRLLAFYLQRLRERLGASLHVTVNGGYRSPSHRAAVGATPHMWGTAADLYRIGSAILRERGSIEMASRVAEELSEDLHVKPFGHDAGQTDDHIHLDLGYVTLVPREMSEDSGDSPQASPRFAFEEPRRRSDTALPPSDSR
jgi:hypothetical protein